MTWTLPLTRRRLVRHRRERLSPGFTAAREPRRRTRKKRRAGRGGGVCGGLVVSVSAPADAALPRRLLLIAAPLVVPDNHGRHVRQGQRRGPGEVPGGVDDPADAAVALEQGLRRGRQRQPARGEELVPFLARERAEAEEPLGGGEEPGIERGQR